MRKNSQKITNAELAILSLVAEQPVYGYQIEQIIEQRGMRDWTEICFSSIYYILNKMEKQGLVKSQLENPDQQGPARRVYHLTPLGKTKWQSATLQALSNPHPPTSEFQLGLANLPLINKIKSQNALNIYAKSLNEHEKIVKAKKDSYGASIPFQVEAMFDLSLKLIQVEKKWVEVFILKQGKGS